MKSLHIASTERIKKVAYNQNNFTFMPKKLNATNAKYSTEFSKNLEADRVVFYCSSVFFKFCYNAQICLILTTSQLKI